MTSQGSEDGDAPELVRDDLHVADGVNVSLDVDDIGIVERAWEQNPPAISLSLCARRTPALTSSRTVAGEEE